MKKTIAIFSLFIFMAAAMPIRAFEGPASIYITPPAPKFTNDERQSELARRRAAVAAAMADKSVLILFSAEPKLYTNDVDYVFRQENNLYYLTNLKQAGAPHECATSRTCVENTSPSGMRWVQLPAASSSHACRLSSRHVRSRLRSNVCSRGASTGATASTRRWKLRGIQSADPMKNSSAPALAKCHTRECSRKRPMMLRTRMFSLTPGIPGRRQQMPRTIRSMCTPACEAR